MNVSSFDYEGRTLPRPTSFDCSSHLFGCDETSLFLGFGIRGLLKLAFADDRVVDRRDLVAAFELDLLFLALVDLGDADDMLVSRDLEDRDTLRVAAHDADVADRRADHLALVGDEHQLLALARREARHDTAVALGGVDVGDALAAAIGAAIFVSRRALAIAVLSDGEDELLFLRQLLHALGGQRRLPRLVALPRREAEIVFALLLRGADAVEDRHGDDFVAGLEAHAPDAHRRARLEFADVGRLEADRLAVSRGEEDVVALGEKLHAD